MTGSRGSATDAGSEAETHLVIRLFFSDIGTGERRVETARKLAGRGLKLSDLKPNKSESQADRVLRLVTVDDSGAETQLIMSDPSPVQPV